MLPGMPKELKQAQVDDRELARVEAIIHSMTLQERREPSVINGSRRLRIANGSGSTTSEVNLLLKQFKEMQRMMKTLGVGPRGKKGKKGGKGRVTPRLRDVKALRELQRTGELSRVPGIPGLSGLPGMPPDGGE